MADHPLEIRENGRKKASTTLNHWVGQYRGTTFVQALGSHFVGALGELAAARIVKARIVSHHHDDFDLSRQGTIDFEVKAGFARQKSPKLAGKVFDRYCEVKLQVRDVNGRKEIWAVECFTRNRGGTDNSLAIVQRSFRPFLVFVAGP